MANTISAAWRALKQWLMHCRHVGEYRLHLLPDRRAALIFHVPVIDAKIGIWWAEVTVAAFWVEKFVD